MSHRGWNTTTTMASRMERPKGGGRMTLTIGRHYPITMATLCLLLLLLLATPPATGTALRKCGGVHWAPDAGFREFELGNFGFFFRNDATERAYADAAGCKCSELCAQTEGCQRWVVKPRYKATVSLTKNQCDNSTINRDRCGYESTCLLRKDIQLVYDGTIERPTSDGYIGTVTGTRSCPVGTSKCHQTDCCDLKTHMCHHELGCVSRPQYAKKVSGDFRNREWVVIPIALAGVLLLAAIIHKVSVWVLVVHGTRAMKPLDLTLDIFLTDAGQWVFVLTEFVLAFWVLSKVDGDTMARVRVGQLDHCLLCDYDENVKIQYRYAAMVDRSVLEGGKFPQILNHNGKYYSVYGIIYDPFWFTWFQYTLYILLPLQIILRGMILFHKSWLWWKYAQGKPITTYVWIYIVGLEIFGHLEPGFMMEPVHRAWTPELFCSWGMQGPYIFTVVFYFVFQVIYVLSCLHKYMSGTIDPLTLKMAKPRTLLHRLSRLVSFYAYLMFFCLMILLSLVYKITTPPGPPQYRVWFFFIGPIFCKFIQLILVPFNHGMRTKSAKLHQAPTKPLGNFVPVGPGNPITSMSDSSNMNMTFNSQDKTPKF